MNKKESLDLSIIIVSYNTLELTSSCIETIYKSKPGINFEVIVVDNASNDGSIEALYKLSKKYPRVQIVKNESNLGFSKANNIGINKSVGRFKLLLNSDTEIKGDALDKLVRYATKTIDAGVIGPRLLNKNGSVQPSCYNFPTISNAIKQFWLRKGKPFDKFYPNNSEPTCVDSVVGAAFLITPQAINEVGLLDDKYFFYFEDLDYCKKVNNLGLKVYYLPSAEIYHMHGASGSDDTSYGYLIKSSRLYHGLLRHYVINIIIKTGQIWNKYLLQ